MTGHRLITYDGNPIKAKSVVSKDDFVFLHMEHKNTGKMIKPFEEMSSTLRWSNSFIDIDGDFDPTMSWKLFSRE